MVILVNRLISGQFLTSEKEEVFKDGQYQLERINSLEVRWGVAYMPLQYKISCRSKPYKIGLLYWNLWRAILTSW